MKFIPKQHGSFQLRWQGDVFIVEYFDTWNELTVQNMLAQAIPMWEQREQRAWGLLSDARLWTGATPEAIEAWWRFFEIGVDYGMAAFTGMLPSELHVRLVSTLSERASQIVPYERSETLEAAFSWLSKHGISHLIETSGGATDRA